MAVWWRGWLPQHGMGTPHVLSFSAEVLGACLYFVLLCVCVYARVSSGAPLMGLLDLAGIGEAVEIQGPLPVDELKGDCLKHNCALLQMLTEDPLGAELTKLTSFASNPTPLYLPPQNWFVLGGLLITCKLN